MIVNLWLHLLAAITWVGGMLFISLVLVPVSRKLPPPGGVQLLREAGRRFRWVAWPAIAILFVTGLENARQRGYLEALFQGTLLETAGGRFMAAKALLVLLMVILSILHDFVLGPRAAALEAAAYQGGIVRRRLLPKVQGSWNVAKGLLRIRGGDVVGGGKEVIQGVQEIRRSNQPDSVLLARAAQLRKATSWIARLNGLFALSVVLLGILTRRG